MDINFYGWCGTNDPLWATCVLYPNYWDVGYRVWSSKPIIVPVCCYPCLSSLWPWDCSERQPWRVKGQQKTMGSPWKPPVKKTSAISAGRGEDEPDLTGASAGTNDSHFTPSGFHLKTTRRFGCTVTCENKLLKQKRSPLDTSAWIKRGLTH